MLALLEGVVTARLPLAQAKVLGPLGFRETDPHWLHPEHKTSSCQCVALVVDVGSTV